MFPGGSNEVILQQKPDGYSGTSDTYILAWSPSANYGNQANLRVKNDSVYSSLLRFDLSSIPTGAEIYRATLSLYAYNRDSAQPFELRAYALLRPWAPLEATWERASYELPWGVPGANDTTTDREADPIASVTVSALNTWYDFDITALVKRWVAQPFSNRGVLLKGLGYIS